MTGLGSQPTPKYFFWAVVAEWAAFLCVLLYLFLPEVLK